MRNITVYAKNVTPICQIDGTTKREGLDYITIKTITKIVDGEPVRVPVYTANAFRGILRRKASEIIAQKAVEKGLTLSVSDFHIMFAGGGTGLPSPDFETKERIRGLNPVVSLFGTGLAVEGKLIVTALEPEEPRVSGGRSEIVSSFVFIKRDDLLDGTKFARFVSKKDIDEWERYVNEEQKKRKEDRSAENTGDQKTKKTTVKHIQGKYYIAPGVKFKGFIGYKTQLTPVEYGLLIRAIESVTEEQLGSTKSLGFGICDWKVKFAGSPSEVVATPLEDNLFSVSKSIFYDDEEEMAVKAFDEWLENMGQESISIHSILKGE